MKACLNSVLEQTVKPREVIIADDGSRKETIDLVKDFQKSYPWLNIIHSWQEDDGFRLSMSRNKAINCASGKYLIIIDGDLILEKHFIQDHIENMEKGYFVQGSRVIVDEKNSKNLLKNRMPNFIFRLFEKGFKNKANMIRCGILSKMFIKRN